MTFWPEKVPGEIATDEMIPALTSYGVQPGAAGYSLADLRCTPRVNRYRVDGIYSGIAVGIVLSGAFEYRSGRSSGIAVPGTLVLANADEEFTCYHLHEEGNRRVALFFSVGMIEAVAEDLCFEAPEFQAALIPPSRLTPVVSGLLVRIARAGPDDEEIALAVAQTALQAAADRPHQESVPTTDARRLLEAVRYIDCHFAEDCTLDTLASVAGMSRFRFARRFRVVTGETAAQYVINRRLSAAAARLASTTQSVSGIAYDVGFNDLSHFNARFKSTFGCTPTAWRR